MATTPPVMKMPAEARPGTSMPPAAAAGGAEHALVASPKVAEAGAGTAFGPRVLRLPVEMGVAVPVRGFRVRNLLALAPDQSVESRWSSGIDLPLAVGDVTLAWAEFEVVETKLAVRVTRVA